MLFSTESGSAGPTVERKIRMWNALGKTVVTQIVVASLTACILASLPYISGSEIPNSYFLNEVLT